MNSLKLYRPITEGRQEKRIWPRKTISIDTKENKSAALIRHRPRVNVSLPRSITMKRGSVLARGTEGYLLGILVATTSAIGH